MIFRYSSISLRCQWLKSSYFIELFLSEKFLTGVAQGTAKGATVYVFCVSDWEMAECNRFLITAAILIVFQSIN